MNEHRTSSGAQPAQDVYTLRKNKRRRRMIRRVLLFVLLSAFIMVLYVNRELWIPKLEKIGQSQQFVQQSDGALVGNHFPLSIYGGASYQTGTIDDRLLILSDTYLYLYKADGSLEDARQHAYGSAMLQTAGNYALVYENGSARFRLETKSKTVYEKTSSDNIVFGRVSQDGMVALVTTSDTSACTLIVYNADGKAVYQRNCINQLVEVIFDTENGGCYAVSIRTKDGVLQSVVNSYDFRSEQPRWTSAPLDMMCVSVYNTKDGGVFVLGDVGCAYLDVGGAVRSTYTYPDSLVCADFCDDTAAILLRNEEKRTNTVALLKKNSTEPVMINFDSTVKDVAVDSNTVTVQTRTAIEVCDHNGQKIATATTPNSERFDRFESFLPMESYIFLMGYDTIDRIEAP